jgi:hypothetical protein
MKTRNQSMLASGLILLVGLWTLLSPLWISMESAALVSTLITGAVIIVASVVQYFVSSTVPSWITGVAALWLLLSAIIFGVSSAAAWSLILSAIAVASLAYWDGSEISQLQNSGERHHPTAA